MTNTAEQTTYISNSAVAGQLKKVLADSYALYLKTQNYHWNVTGPQFSSLHLMFEAQYTDLAVAIDEIAERIRSLGEKAPGTWKAYEAISSIKDGDEHAKAETMVRQLAGDQHSIIATLKATLDAADDADDQVTEDLMIGRIAVHEKNAWMLKSSIE